MICHFSHKSVVAITHEQNIIWSETHFDSTTHEQTIICRQLFAGHVVGSRPVKREKNMHRMVIAKRCDKQWGALKPKLKDKTMNQRQPQANTPAPLTGIAISIRHCFWFCIRLEVKRLRILSLWFSNQKQSNHFGYSQRTDIQLGEPLKRRIKYILLVRSAGKRVRSFEGEAIHWESCASFTRQITKEVEMQPQPEGTEANLRQWRFCFNTQLKITLVK